MRVRSIRYSGRRWSKLISTITSVPPAIGTAVGCSAFAASASSQLAGRRKSMTGSLLRLVGRTDQASPGAAGAARSWDVHLEYAQYTAVCSARVSHGNHEGVGWPT